MRDYYPTKHAVQSMSARDVDWTTVLWVLEKPEVVYSSNTGPHAGKATEIHQRGELYCVVSKLPVFDRHDVAEETPLYAVITVGLRSTLTWNNDDARNRARRS